MTAPEYRGSGDDGRIPAPRGFLLEHIARAVVLLVESVQEDRPADYAERRARWLEIAEAVRRNG